MLTTDLADLAIGWYDVTARDLPWRSPGTSPWGILVSEVMLQQTPVSRVTPVYLDWLRRWPAPAHLAAEPAGEAIRAWGRLGYPRRALRLHACATTLVAHHHGAVPSDVAILLELPGVGAYTARAVAAFAFGQRQPVVDTNVRRLVARAHGGLADGGTATTAADLATVAALLPEAPARAARASAAFMELGAVVCTARSPSCQVCPLRPACTWHSTGRPEPTHARPRRGQTYVGTDRQVRGLIMALARANADGITQEAVDAAWSNRVQLRRALTGLLTDGLLVPLASGSYGLPGYADAEAAGR